MLLVYVAGPYSAPTELERTANVLEALAVAARVAALGHMPVTPHALSMHIGDQQTPEHWYLGTLLIMLRCDAVVLTPRWPESRGAVNERRVAESIGLAVYERPEDIPEPGEGKPARVVIPAGLAEDACGALLGLSLSERAEGLPGARSGERLAGQLRACLRAQLLAELKAAFDGFDFDGRLAEPGAAEVSP